MTNTESSASRLQPVLTASLHPSPTNPRKTFAGDAWDAFVENVRAVGIMQPILVRPWPEEQAVSGVYALGVPLYEIVAGERRYRAAIACELDMVPALIRDLTTAEVVRLQMVENLQREDLHPLEEAEGYALMVREHGFTADTLAAEIGKSRAYIYGRMKLLDARDEVKEAMRSGELAMSIGELIARIPSPALQVQAMNEVLRNEMTHRAAARHIQERYMLALKSAPFPRDDAGLVPAAGTCAACPKRTGNARDLFADVSGTDVCTDPECYRDKRVANMRREQAKAEAAGAKVVTGDEARKILPWGADSSATGSYEKASTNAYSMPRNDKGELQKIGDIAKAAGVQPVLVADEDSGKLVKLYDTKAIKAALKAKGDDAVLDAQDKQRQEDRERKAEQVFRRALYFQHIRAKIGAELDGGTRPTLDRWHLELVTAHMWGSLPFDGQKIVVDHVLDPSDGDIHSRVRALTNGLSSMTDGQLLALQIDCAIVGTLSAPSYCAPKTPQDLLDLATQWQVDARAVRKALQDAAKEKAKGTKKGSAKKVVAPIAAAQAQEQIAPETESERADAWPFPRGPVSAPVDEVPDAAKPKLKAARPKSAAQAQSLKSPKKKDQAATAARKKKSSGRASPAGGDEGAGATASDDEGAIERCTRTIDAFEGQAACEQGVSA